MFDRCTTCGHIRRPGHVCDPVWTARINDPMNADDWYTVRASTAQEAAERFCEKHDDEDDYGIVESGEASVVVKSRDDVETTWFVEAWAQSTYRAKEVTP